MIIFLYGPDDYRRLQKKNGLIAEFRKEHSALGIGYFDGGDDGALDAFVAFSRSPGLFESAKFAVLENAFELDPDKLAGALKPLADEKSVTVFISESGKPAKALAFLLKAPARAEKFDALKGAEWNAFIRAEAKKNGLALAADAVQFLGEVHEGNSWALVTELQKISSLAAGSENASGRPAGPVDKQALDALGLETAPNYWALLNGLKSPDGRIRLSALEKLFSINDPPPKIFNILAAQAGEKTPRMAAYDLAVKSGKLEYEEALLDLALG